MEITNLLLSLLGLTFRMPEISATTTILIITVILSLYAESDPMIKAKWMMNPFRIIHRGEYYRLITSGFIHSGYIHLAFNMFVLHSFGPLAEYITQLAIGPTYGTLAFVAIYLLAMVVADIPSLLKHQNNDWYNALGASGAISAIVFFCIMFNPTGMIGFIFIPIQFPGFVLGILYLFYSYYMARNSNDNIGHDAHLFGALFGIVASIVVFPNVVFSFFQRISEWAGFF